MLLWWNAPFLLYYVKAILIRRGPWPWNAGACLRGACAELARGLREKHGAIFRKGAAT